MKPKKKVQNYEDIAVSGDRRGRRRADSQDKARYVSYNRYLVPGIFFAEKETDLRLHSISRFFHTPTTLYIKPKK